MVLDPQSAARIELSGTPLDPPGDLNMEKRPSTMVAINEALIISSLRQNEMIEEAERLNIQLSSEIARRKNAEIEMRKLNCDLERRVTARTAELSAANTLLIVEIAERKHAEIELLKAFRLADEANNAKSAFLARMSHEIRTPMNGIVGLSFLLKHSPLNVKQSNYVNNLEYSAQKLMAILNDILDFSKIEAGRMELECAEFDLEELLSRLMESIAIQAERKLLDSKLTLAPRMPTLLIGDSLRLWQILNNLLSNAIKFTERGKIEVSVAPLEVNIADVLLEFKVSDTGIGIQAAHIAGMFDPFSQSDTSTSRRFGGTGLGLAICKCFVKLMHGEIAVQSQPGYGSTFTFTARFKLNEPAGGTNTL